MDHDVVVRQQMTEKYLLGELGPEVRNEFEEHFFDCPDCALDVRAGASFVEQSKLVLAGKSEPAPAGLPAIAAFPTKSGWFAWLRPAITAPVMALLLIVVAYQNLITYPQLRQELNNPRIVSFASLNIGAWGSGGPVIQTHPGEGFLLFVRIPPDGYARHTADLYNPAGKLEWSLPVPPSSGQDQWPVHVPGAHREGGTYTLVVRGVTAAGGSKEVGRASFELQISK